MRVDATVFDKGNELVELQTLFAVWEQLWRLQVLLLGELAGAIVCVLIFFLGFWVIVLEWLFGLVFDFIELEENTCLHLAILQVRPSRGFVSFGRRFWERNAFTLLTTKSRRSNGIGIIIDLRSLSLHPNLYLISGKLIQASLIALQQLLRPWIFQNWRPKVYRLLKTTPFLSLLIIDVGHVSCLPVWTFTLLVLFSSHDLGFTWVESVNQLENVTDVNFPLVLFVEQLENLVVLLFIDVEFRGFGISFEGGNKFALVLETFLTVVGLDLLKLWIHFYLFY